jgi:hypothetical protein
MCAGGHGIYKDSIDYSVFRGDWLIGRIYERKGFPDDVRFFWSLHGVVLTRPPDIRTDGHTPSHSPNATRLVRQHRFDGGPFIIAEFVAHDSRLRFRSLNHFHRVSIKPQCLVAKPLML